MTFRPIVICAAALFLTVALSGCGPSSEAGDEEREAHFLSGKALVGQMDYKGAVEAFEKALEVNPRSAAAHFEIALLYDQKETDPAAAIFHYQRYLKFRPVADNEEMVQSRILACKQELAQDVSGVPVTRTVEREREKLAAENAKLRTENSALRAAMVRPAPVTSSSSTIPPVTPVVLRVVNVSGGSHSGAVAAATGSSTLNVSRSDSQGAVGTHASPAFASRTHSVKPGENLTLIARKYGVKVSLLMAANPRVDERRLRIGQTLAIPRA